MDLFDRLSLALPRLRLLREEPLAAHTSFRIGGPAEVMAFPSSLAELQALLRLSAQEGIRVRLLGAGTNILAPDGGVRGLVIVTSGALTGLSCRMQRISRPCPASRWQGSPALPATTA